MMNHWPVVNGQGRVWGMGHGAKNLYSLLSLLCILLITLHPSLVTPVYSKVIAKVEVDKREITIGDPIRYTLTIEVDKDTSVELPLDAPTLSFRPFDLLGQQGMERGEVGGKRFYKVVFLLTAYELGELDIPSLKIYYKEDVSGKEGEVATEAIRVTVKGVATPSAEEIKPLKAPLSPGKIRTWPIWQIVGLLIVMVALGAILFMIVKRIRREEAVQVPTISPAEVAIRELERIEGLLEDIGFKAYYGEVAGVVRRFLSARFQILVDGKTTTELIDALLAIPGVDSLGVVKGLLSDCDLVKFARYAPRPEEVKEVVERARGVVTTFSSQTDLPR